jgi:hypothetical protein
VLRAGRIVQPRTEPIEPPTASAVTASATAPATSTATSQAAADPTLGRPRWALEDVVSVRVRPAYRAGTLVRAGVAVIGEYRTENSGEVDVIRASGHGMAAAVR